MRRLLQNYEVHDLFSISILLLVPRLNQTLFYTSSSLSLSFCRLMQPTVSPCSPTPRLGSAYAPCPSNLFIHILGNSCVTDSNLNGQPPVFDNGQPVSFPLPYSICTIPIASRCVDRHAYLRAGNLFSKSTR